jgi:hypothetical protein
VFQDSLAKVISESQTKIHFAILQVIGYCVGSPYCKQLFHFLVLVLPYLDIGWCSNSYTSFNNNFTSFQKISGPMLAPKLTLKCLNDVNIPLCPLCLFLINVFEQVLFSCAKMAVQPFFFLLYTRVWLIFLSCSGCPARSRCQIWTRCIWKGALSWNSPRGFACYRVSSQL